jgi:IS30 family transposase
MVARSYAKHSNLEREGVTVRAQLKMTPRVVARARKPHAEGNSLAEVGRQLGVEASTVAKALKRSGVKLRPPVADRWHGSRED